MKKQLLQILALIFIELIVLYPVSFAHAFSISNVTVSDISSGSAKISWFTDDVADGKVRYGKTTGLGFTSRHSTYVFDHSRILQSLESETKYYFKIESEDISGTNLIDDNNGQLYTFTTKDITPPSKITSLELASVTESSISISWDPSNENDLSHYNVYRDRIKIKGTTETNFNDTALSLSSSFSYKVSAVDISGNEGILSNTVIGETKIPDFYIPKINNIDIVDVKDNSGTITWNTNENSTSVVYYWIDSSVSIFKLDQLTMNHSVVLTNLVKGKTYNFIASSCDSSNNCVNSSVSSFEAGIDIVPPKINASIAKFFNKRSIDIFGTTEPFSSVKLFVNDLNFPVRALDKNEVPLGKFKFSGIFLQKENVIKISVVDKAGNLNEAIYRISVDTEDPVVVLDNIPGIVSKSNVSVVGAVNEPVFISIFLRAGEESAPKIITGLNATIIENSVKLEWEESESNDFSHYVVYRKDIGPIALTQPISYNTYTDLLVNKGREYTYFITAVNKFGRESEKSDPITVKILDGRNDIKNPAQIDTLILEKPLIKINASGSFSESVKLGKDDTYTLTIEVIDRAKNRVIFERTIRKDTKAPDIKITSPPNGQLIFENYANQVDIKGTTEPNARVHLFVERSPLGFLDKSFDISGLPNKITHIDETDLDADCRLEIGLTNYCPTGADYSTTADSNGNFEFEDVDLTSFLSGGFRLQQLPGAELDDYRREVTDSRRLQEARDARMVVIATDQSGIRNAKDHRIRIGNCWTGDQSWDIIPLVEFQSPATISPQRLAENREAIYFFFNYSYIGRGKDGKINPSGISMKKICDGTEFLDDDRFEISCKLMPPGGFSTAVNPEGTISYTSMNLNRMEGMDGFLQHDWEDLFDSLNNELTFPVKVIMRYTHTVDGKEITETQTTCQEVTYDLDNSLIDPRNVLPDWLLYDFVDFLGDSIDALNDVNEKLGKVLDFVVVGCVSSFMLRLGFQIYRRFISFGEEKIFQLKDISSKLLKNNGDVKFNVENDEDQKYCNELAKKMKEAELFDEYNPSDKEKKLLKMPNPFFNLKLKYFSDKDLEKCFPKVAAAWKTEAFWYDKYRLTCDRVFGHKTPSKWTENLDDEKISQRLQQGSACSTDQSVFGKPLRPVKCKEVATEFGKLASDYQVDELCFKRPVKGGNELYKLGRQVLGASNIYELTAIKDIGFKSRITYAIKQTETSYLTSQDRSCKEVCKGDVDKKTTETFTFNGTKINLIGKPGAKEDQQIGYGCVEASTCTAWGVEQKMSFGANPIKIDSTFKKGYTSDCFPPETDFSSVSDDPNQRVECCCINTAGEEPPTFYYVYDDVNKYENHETKKKEPAFQSKKDSKEKPGFDRNLNGEDAYNDMKWSYRYWKEGYKTLDKDEKEHSIYNPDRYIEGRDFPACFGQNNWIFDYNVPAGDTGKVVTLDSRQQHTSAFQCANIAGIQNRLTMINNMQSALASCLIDVRRTGTSDAAACKELFTRYICSSIWQVISLFTDNCAPFSLGIGIEDEDDYLGTVKDGFKSISQSTSDSMSELQSEYGNAELNNLIGAGQGEIARKVCLGAFGYDWDFNLENVIDAAYSQSFATLVQRTTATREYLTIHPTKGQATYDYRASWIINPGCDIENYKVDLVCVNRDEMNEKNGIRCDKIGSPDGSNCDCLDSDLSEGDRSKRFFSSKGKLNQNEFVQDEWSDIITSDYRYDHLKFTLRADRDLRGDLSKSCFPTGREDGVFYFNLRDKSMRDITACVADITSGIYRCSGGLDFWSQKGLGRIDEILINDDKPEDGEVTVFIGDPLTITPTIFKTPGSSNKCLVAELEKRGVETLPQAIVIDRDGPIKYPETQLESDIQPSTYIKTLPEPRVVSCDPDEDVCNSMKKKKLSIEKINRDNKNSDVDITLTFTDNPNNKNSRIDLSDNSMDTMSMNGISNVLGRGGWWDDKYNGPVVDISGIKFKITDVPFDDDLTSITYKATVPKVEEDKGSQTWTLKLSLFEADEDTGGCSRYNAGELTEYEDYKQQKTYRIKIKSPAELADYPKIKLSFGKDKKGNTKNYLNPDDEEDIVKLNIEVTDYIGSYHNLAISYLYHPGHHERSEIDCPSVSVSSTEGKKRECSLELNMEKLDVETYYRGTYGIKIIAEDTDTFSHTKEAETAIEVRCGPSGTSYGQCFEINKCLRQQIIFDGEIGCRDGYECCKIGEIQTT